MTLPFNGQTQENKKMNRTVSHSEDAAGLVAENYRTPGSHMGTSGPGPSTSEVLRTLSAMERLLLS